MLILFVSHVLKSIKYCVYLVFQHVLVLYCVAFCRCIMFSGIALFCIVVAPSYIFASSNIADGTEPTWFGIMQDYWWFRLLLNLLGYATIVIPGYLFIRYVKTSKWLENSGNLSLLFYLPLLQIWIDFYLLSASVKQWWHVKCTIFHIFCYLFPIRGMSFTL